MKVLFLDIDGVLNSRKWFGSLHATIVAAKYPEEHFDPAAVARVNAIVERTGAVICVSSSWRLGRSVAELGELLATQGIRAEVVGATPVDFRARGLEIARWLAEHPEVTVYAILDDDSDMRQLARQHVKTDFEDGLLDHHVESAVSLLGVVDGACRSAGGRAF